MHSLFITPITTTPVQDTISSLDYSKIFLTWLPASTFDCLHSVPHTAATVIFLKEYAISLFKTSDSSLHQGKSFTIRSSWSTPAHLPNFSYDSPLGPPLHLHWSPCFSLNLPNMLPPGCGGNFHFAWNGPCPDICMSVSLTSFKNLLKCHLSVMSSLTILFIIWMLLPAILRTFPASLCSTQIVLYLLYLLTIHLNGNSMRVWISVCFVCYCMPSS